MKRVWLASALAAAATLGGARLCRAGGFLIYDLSGEAIGRASAVAASTDEPAAIWFNPAALSFMGPGASAGGVYVTVEVALFAGRRRRVDGQRARQLLPADGVREHAGQQPRGGRPGRLHRVRHRRALARRLDRARGDRGRLAGDAGHQPDGGRAARAPAVAGGRLRRGPRRGRLHERPSGAGRRRRAPGRRHLGIRRQRRPALPAVTQPAARRADLPQPRPPEVQRAGRFRSDEPGLRARAARSTGHGDHHAARRVHAGRDVPPARRPDAGSGRELRPVEHLRRDRDQIPERAGARRSIPTAATRSPRASAATSACPSPTCTCARASSSTSKRSRRRAWAPACPTATAWTAPSASATRSTGSRSTSATCWSTCCRRTRRPAAKARRARTTRSRSWWASRCARAGLKRDSA